MITNRDATMYERSGGMNIDLVWGIVMLAFGALFLVLALRAAKRRAAETPRYRQEGNSACCLIR